MYVYIDIHIFNGNDSGSKNGGTVSITCLVILFLEWLLNGKICFFWCHMF